MPQTLSLRIILLAPPAGVDFGVQAGRGPTYTTVHRQRSDGRDLSFQFTIAAASDARTGPPDFRGPMVQGAKDQRFVYIDIGTYAGQSDSPWDRRLKIPLTGITWEMLDGLSGHPAAVLETRVAGTGRDGGPNCGTVKPFAGWILVE